jgi:2-polyprenyl-3-methyl-5-hydroxy-6-metoxy-1,4-benzoquinol methylase
MNHENDFWQEEELERVNRCPVCGGADAVSRYSSQPDRLEGVPGLWSVQECLQCHSCYLTIRPTSRAISKIYAKTYYTHSDPRALNEADNGRSFPWRLVNGYLNWRYGAKRKPAFSIGALAVMIYPPVRYQLDYFFRFLDKENKGRLLDIGCGNGQFLHRAKEAGWSVMGIEPDGLAVSKAHAAGLDVWRGGFESVPGNGDFDVVTASHVIEHVHDPLALLLSMNGHLRTGGRIWLATPNVHATGHRIFGKYWFPLEIPRHLQIFSRHGLLNLLVKAGFCNIQFHAKGRGNSRMFFRNSAQYAKEEGKEFPHPPIFLIDAFASILPAFSEELIVTAYKQ